MKREMILNIGGREVTVTALRYGQSIVVERGAESYTVQVVGEKVIGSQVTSIAPPTVAAPAAAPSPAAKREPSAESNTLGAVPSPMTGVVDNVLVQEGAHVNEGDRILVLEAMKMYIDVTAPASGTVSGITVRSGDTVKEGQPLMTIE